MHVSLYNVMEAKWNNLRTIRLIDREGEAEAEVMPGLGNNLFRLQFGQRSILLPPPVTKNLNEFSSKFGTPVLFPPNRIRHGQFSFDNRSYQFPRNLANDHIHGEIRHRPWNVVKQGVNEEWGAYVTSEFNLADCPEILGYFPHRLVFRITYSLKNGRLCLMGEIENTDEIDAPLFLGFHPYFLYQEDRAQDTVIVIPAKREWKVNEDGYVVAENNETEICSKLHDGLSLQEIPARNGYRLFELDYANSCCELIDKKSGNGIRFTVSHSFPFIVLYRPTWASAISLEPYTCLTDPYNLSAIVPDIYNERLRVGDVFKYSFIIERA